MFCIKCGKEIADGSKFCKFCGAQLGDSVKGSDTSVGTDTLKGTDTRSEEVRDKKKGGKGIVALLIAILVLVLVGGAIGVVAYINLNTTRLTASELEDDDDDKKSDEDSDKEDEDSEDGAEMGSDEEEASKDKTDEEDDGEADAGYLAEPEEEAQEDGGDGIVVNSKMGFSVTVPQSFDGEVDVEENEWGMSFFAKKCKKTGGLLFYVSSMPEEELEDYSDMFDDPIVLGRQDGMVYIMGGPTDCEFDEDTQELYEELYSHMDEVAATFKFVDGKKKAGAEDEAAEEEAESGAKRRDKKEKKSSSKSGSDYEYLDDFRYILEVTGTKIRSEDDLKDEYDAWERGEAYFDIYETRTGLMPKWGVGCVFPYSQYEYLTEEDLEGLSAKELRYARNEIYARHGKVFKDQELQSYFESQDWYYPWENDGPEYEVNDSSFNEIELANIKMIKKFEK